MTRHGAEQHFIRPDGVYITSELQPTPGSGFNPVADTMAIAARFVAPTGLAGPMAHLADGRPVHSRNGFNHARPKRRWAHLLPTRQLGGLGAPTLRDRWFAFKARVRANVQANKFIQDMRIRPMLPGVVTVDTSPRGPAPSATALAVQSGWAPQPTSPSKASGYTPAQGDPPNNGAVVTAVNLAPSEAGKPINLWQRVMQSGLPPVVAQRAENDVLAKWFGVKTGGGY